MVSVDIARLHMLVAEAEDLSWIPSLPPVDVKVWIWVAEPGQRRCRGRSTVRVQCFGEPVRKSVSICSHRYMLRR